MCSDGCLGVPYREQGFWKEVWVPAQCCQAGLCEKLKQEIKHIDNHSQCSF